MIIRFLIALLACVSLQAAGPCGFIGQDSEALNWQKLAIERGGTVSFKTLTAQTVFLRDLRSGGVRDGKKQRINTYLGTGLGACRTPLVHEIGRDFDTLVNFVAGDYSETNGLTGDASTKYLNTETMFPDLYNADSANHAISYAVWNRTASDEGTFCMGSHDGSFYSYLCPSLSGTTYWCLANNGLQMTVSESNGTGFYLGSRSTDTDRKLYKNGTQIASNSNADAGNMVAGGSANTNRLIFVHTMANWNSTPPSILSPTSRTLAGYQLVSGGVSAAEDSVYYGAWLRLQTKFSRN